MNIVKSADTQFIYIPSTTYNLTTEFAKALRRPSTAHGMSIWHLKAERSARRTRTPCHFYLVSPGKAKLFSIHL